jgi:hypothetical protein
MVSEKKEKGKKKSQKKKPTPMDPVPERPPARKPAARKPAPAPPSPKEPPPPAPAPVAAPGDSATSATGSEHDTIDQSLPERQQIEARLQAALLLAASDLKIDRNIILGHIGDTLVLYQEHLATQMDLKDVIIAAYWKGHEKANAIKHIITNTLAAEVHMGADDVFSLLNWGPVYDRWAAEDGVDHLKLEVMMRDTLTKFIDFQQKKGSKAKTPEKPKTPPTKPQEKVRQENFKQTVNSEDAKSKREKALEDRQAAKREKKLQKARGLVKEQMQATENVETDDEEDNNYNSVEETM